MNDKPREIQRTIQGWRVSLAGDYIKIVTPTGAESKIHISEQIPIYPLVSKEVHVLTRTGSEYKTIKLQGPQIPLEVHGFIRRLKKAIHFR